MRVTAIVLFVIFSSSPLLGVLGKGPRLAKNNEFTNVVSIKRRSIIKLFDRHRCMGSLITLKWFSTSTPCAEAFKDEKENFRVYVGGRFFWNARLPYFSGGAQTSEIDDIQMISTEIYLVKVNPIFIETDSVNVAPLNFREAASNFEVVMPSWGRLKLPNRLLSAILPNFYLASPWLRVYDTLDDLAETPCPEDTGAPIMKYGEFIAIYHDIGSCRIQKAALESGVDYLELGPLESQIRAVIPELPTQ